MDLRTRKTESNLINAFIELRSKKAIEKITIKELSELATMNKATFYRHYKDIYDLSESIENHLIDTCLTSIPDPDILFDEAGFFRLNAAFYSNKELFDIIFSGSRSDIAVHKIHEKLCEMIYKKHPEIQADLRKNVLLSAMIFGCIHAYFAHRDEDDRTVIESLSKTSVLWASILQ